MSRVGSEAMSDAPQEAIDAYQLLAREGARLSQSHSFQRIYRQLTVGGVEGYYRMYAQVRLAKGKQITRLCPFLRILPDHYGLLGWYHFL